jgi:LuxR family maltose regulon positive regulatory protein
MRSRHDATLRAWLDKLPDELVRLRPVLSAGYVGILLHRGDLGSVEERLQDAERSMETAVHVSRRPEGAANTPVYVDEGEFRELPGMLALYRAGYAQVTGNLPDAVRYARRALELMPQEQPLRGGAQAILGLALWSSGDLEGAHRTFSEGIGRVHRGGYVNDSSTIMLNDMRVGQGRLSEALDSYRKALQVADEKGKAAPIGTADLHVGISEVYREQGNLEAAIQHLLTSKDLGEMAGLPENRFRWFTAMAGVKQSQQDLDGALAMLDEAERLYAGGFSPDVHPIDAIRTRICLIQGRLAEAERWVEAKGLLVNDELTYLREFQHITLARLLLARAERDADGQCARKADGLLDRLLEAAEAGGRGGAVIELFALKALAASRLGAEPAALTHLQRALQLAEPEGYARIFLDEGPALQRLLERLATGAGGNYARRLLDKVPGEDEKAGTAPHSQESLSDRELEVMRLLASDLSGPEIAHELVVSLNTVRTHTKSIYTKLGVNSRRAAIRKADELHLL